MEKLTSFRWNDTFKLFHLAKELQKTNFFQSLLTDFQYKIISFILTKDDFKLWTNFIDGNCTLKIDKEKSGPENPNANTEQDIEEDEEEVDDDDGTAFEEGDEPLVGLALHVRYLLWEKAIDFYYSSKDLDNSGNQIEEVNDDHELIDRIDRENESDTSKESKEEKAPQVKVRTEEDDYDDDEDEDEEEDAKKEIEPVQNGEEEKQELETDERNHVILTIPVSVLKAVVGSNHQESSPRSEASEQLSTINNGINNGGEGTISSAELLLVREINKVYHNFEYDRETLLKRRKLEKSDKQLEESQGGDDRSKMNGSSNSSSSQSNGSSTLGGLNSSDGTSATSSSGGQTLGINLGSASHSLKHLLKTIHHQREEIGLNDYELRSLFMDVRKNRGKWSNDERIGQEELYEGCEKVIIDLRGYTEHSTPFLNKVSKREAPNYGLIIKKPMDLNTVMKKLKSFQYDSKQQFVDDLNLIWSNCLAYNADPKHFLRAHAIAMQKRTNKLIPSIPDITIRSRAEVEKEEEMEEAAAANATASTVASKTSSTAPTTDGKTSSATTTKDSKTAMKGRKRNKADSDTEDMDADKDKEKESEIKVDDQVKIKSEDAEQDIEMTDAFTLASSKDATAAAEGSMMEEDEDEDEDDVNDDNGPELANEEMDLDIQAWRSMTAKSRADYCSKRSELFIDNKLNPDSEAMVRDASDLNYFKTYLANEQIVKKNSSNLLDIDNEPYLIEYDVMGGLPGLKYAGIDAEEELKREQKLVDVYLQQLGGDASKIKSNLVLSTDSGLNKMYHEIIGKIQDIRKICFKISLIRQMQTQQFVHHTQMKQPEVEEIQEIDVDPVSKLSNHDPFSSEVQYSVLRRAVSKVAMQTGFELTENFAINSLTQVTERYISSLVRTMKTHMETSSSNKLSVKEALLASLLENGMNKPDDLYTFVQERIIKQLEKLKDLKIKLSNFLKDLLRPSLENFNEKSFNDNSEQFMTGDFSEDLGDDFFGFKELGLDKEFNMLSGSIPIYLLHSRLHNSYISTGSASKKNKYEDLKDMKDVKLMASEISKQVGILQPFYKKLLEKSKTFYIKGQKKKGELTELPPLDQFCLIEDEDLPQKQKNIRPRLPPTGKIVSVKKRMIANAYILPDVKEEDL